MSPLLIQNIKITEYAVVGVVGRCHRSFFQKDKQKNNSFKISILMKKPSLGELPKNPQNLELILNKIKKRQTRISYTYKIIPPNSKLIPDLLVMPLMQPYD
jgi:hypothetical protein